MENAKLPLFDRNVAELVKGHEKDEGADATITSILLYYNDAVWD